MTASKYTKGLLAGIAALALIGTAAAQSNPPNPAVKSAPTGAGQQSTQNTPMGTTGTPTGGGSATAGSTGSAKMGTASSGTTADSSTSMGASSTSADTSMTPSTTKRTARKARADRN